MKRVAAVFRESFVPLLLVLAALLAATRWLDGLVEDYAKQPVIIAVRPAEAAILTENGAVERQDEAVSDPALTSPDVVAARAKAQASDFEGAIALVQGALATAPNDPSLLNELGVHQLRASHLQAAIDSFTGAVAGAPRYARAYYNRAIARGRAGDAAGARADYEESLRLQPGSFEAAHNLGLLLMDTGDLDGAIERLRLAATLGSNDDHARGWFSLGVALMRAKKDREALAAYEKAIEYRPGYLLPRYNQALVHARSGPAGRARAARLLDQVLTLRPDFAPAWLLRGRFASEDGDDVRALELYGKAASYDPSLYKARYNQGLVALRLGRLTLAERLFARLVADFPDRPENHFNLGKIAYQREQPEAAVGHYEKALTAAKGDYPEARLNLGLALRSMGRQDEALAAFDALVAADPKYAPAHLNRALVLMHAKRFDEARAALEQVLALRPDSAAALYNLGKLAARTGDHPAAAAAFRRTLAVDPKHLKAAVSLGVEEAARQRWDEAIAAYQGALAASPTYRPALFNLGVALTKAGRLDQAATAYQQILTLDEADSKAAQNLGAVYARLGRRDLAIAQFEGALDRDPSLVSVRYNLALQFRKQGHNERAATELERVLRLEGTHQRAAITLARIWTDTGKARQAADLLEPLSHRKKARDGVFAALAEAQQALGKRDTARATLEAGLGKHPPSLELASALAEMLRNDGDPAGARRVAEQAAARNPGDPGAAALLKTMSTTNDVP